MSHVLTSVIVLLLLNTVCFLYVLNCFSRVKLFAILWTVACQAPLLMGFSRQEYWSGVPFPSPGDLPPGTEAGSPALQADSLPSEPPGKAGFNLPIKRHRVAG